MNYDEAPSGYVVDGIDYVRGDLYDKVCNLLINYVYHVVDCEGIDFLSDLWHETDLTKEDRELIKQMAYATQGEEQ